MTVLEQESSRPKKQGQRVPVSVYLESEMYDALVGKAARTERSLSDEIRRALRRHLRMKKAAA